MKRLFAALLLALHAGFTVACPATVPVLDASTLQAMARQTDNKGILLKAHRGSSTVWLYGTIHVNEPKNSLPGPVALQALRASDTLFLEIDPLKPENQTNFLKAAEQGEGLDEPQKRRVAALAERYCLPTALKDKSALLAVNTLSMEVLKTDGFFPDYGTDIILRGVAASLFKPVQELETPAQQAEYMSGLTESDAKIDESLDALENGKASRIGQQMVTAWTRQDRQAFKTLGQEIGILDEHLQERNRGMAQRLDSYLTEHPGKLFVATGVFHLVGDDNLAALLKARGFEFER